MGLHNPLTNTSFTRTAKPSIYQTLQFSGLSRPGSINETDASIFEARNRGVTREVLLSVLPTGITGTPAGGDLFTGELLKSTDDGTTWVRHALYAGPTITTVPYPVGGVLMKFKMLSQQSVVDGVQVEIRQ